MSAGGSDLQVGGTLDPAQHIYIERAEDAQLLAWLSDGEYVNILSSRQVGKSSLMMRTRLALVERGRQVALVDVAGMLGSPPSADDWCMGLLGEIVRELGIDKDVVAWWKGSPATTSNQRFISFFRDVVLPGIPGGAVIFLDEIDHTLRLPYTDDFFTAIRAMYNDRAREPLFQRIAFCLAGVATPNELIKDRRTTAYNVGRTLELTDFSSERHNLRPLMTALSADPVQGEQMLLAVLKWTGGHPYLTTRLCEEIIGRKLTSSDQVDTSVDEQYRDLEHLAHDVHFQAITRFLEERLADGPATLGLYERILLGKREPDTPTVYHAQLKLSGLVKRDGSQLVVRNRIYERVFNRAWVERSLPQRSTERVRRYAGIAAALFVASVSLGLGYQFAVVPPRDAARSALAELMATSDERVALDRHALVSGEQASTWQRWMTADIRPQADAALDGFWTRRADVLEQRALTRLRDGQVAEASILGAAAAVKRNGALHPDIQKAFTDRGFAALQLTYVTPSQGSTRPGAVAQFSNSGREILLNPASSGGAELAILEPPDPRPVWRRTFKGEALILASASAAVEIDGSDVRIFRIQRGGNEDLAMPTQTIALPRPIGRLMLFLADSSFLRERIAAEPSLDWLPSWFESMARCLDSSRVDSLRAIGFSGSGRTMALRGNSFTEICSIDDARQRGTIVRRINDGAAPGALPPSLPFRITANDRLMVSPSGTVYDLTSGRVVARAIGNTFPLWVVNNNDLLLNNNTIYRSSGETAYVHTGPGNIVDFTPDGRYVAVAIDDAADPRAEKQPRLEVVSTQDRKVIGRVAGQFEWSSLSATGDLLLTSGVGKDVQLWRTQVAAASPAPQSVPPSSAPRPSVPPAATASASPAPAAPPTPAQRWQNWQTKFGLTLDDNDEPVPLSRLAPHPIAGRATSQ